MDNGDDNDDNIPSYCRFNKQAVGSSEWDRYKNRDDLAEQGTSAQYWKNQTGSPGIQRLLESS